MLPRQGWRAFRTVDELRVLILEYFQWETERVRCPQMIGLAIYLGVSYQTLRQYAKGEYDSDLHRFSEALREASDRVQYEKAAGAIDGRYNGAFVKFDLSVNHDWVDKKSVDVTSNGQTLGAAELAPKAIDPTLTAEDALRSYQDLCRQVQNLMPIEQGVKE